jgi:hypothetical protein
MAQVKISDLSVGDWVLNRQGVPTKVQVVVSEGNMRCGEDAKPEHSVHIWVSDVEPIPITPEILEKNGAKKTEFVKDSGYEFYRCDDLYASRVEGSKWWTIIVRNECREVVNCYVQHIHQLQRALRLASVEKEIEL